MLIDAFINSRILLQIRDPWMGHAAAVTGVKLVLFTSRDPLSKFYR